ncbi:T9SS type A sorting domain-containing protein [Hanstruepera marina]|uniref:T9SS type A sorting domain-containing protein n=1 Tax=Hanstruepera marina TaxID=2873265 RepID=UPI001CA7993D|nr:T9SS type A sorting domain-containing protein [Hanstruepera marina]
MKKNYILFLFTLLTIGMTNAQVTLSQSVDPVNVTDGGVACWNNGNGEYRENSFMRAYNLTDFGITDAFDITSVEYGQGAADDGKEITLNIYTATSDDLTTATLTLVGTASHTSAAADDLTLVSVALSASIPANSTIAFEVLAGDSGTNAGETFFPGINAAGENDDSYLMSASCNINVPTTTTIVGFADNQYVMNVVGNLLSVDEFEMSQISVTPNPAADYINIEIPNNSLNFVSELYDITGKQVLRKENLETLDVSQLKTGIYILRIKTDNGVVSRRIVKE